MRDANYADRVSRNFIAATPSDAVDQPPSFGVVCLTAGNLVAENAEGALITIPMAAGVRMPVSPKRIRTTSTGTYALLR